MKRLKHKILIFLAMICGMAAVNADAQTSMTPSETKTFVSAVTQDYKPWKSVLIDGKIGMDRLPVSPNVKIFMQKGSEITISIRVPLIGEVGRIQLTKTQVLAINKIKKVYAKEQLGDFLTDLPVTLDDVQTMILGRAFVAGQGQLSTLNCDKTKCYVMEEGWLLVPDEPIGGSVNYGFQFGPEGKLEVFTAAPESNAVVASAFYTYDGKKITMDLEAVAGAKEYDATLKMNSFNYNATPLESIRLDKNYQKVSVKEFLKSLSL
ncbi:MAG: DUF4292 domain-containing protein [Bacteroidales bacterium]|nr:DUF4292 domain-containing protein [Bacteroidales bacterium]